MKRMILAGLLLLFIAGCITSKESEVFSMSGLELTSPAFDDGVNIPRKYTCDGEDVNPPLRIEGVPAGTKSIVLIVDDPDAPLGMWVHWVVWNIPPETKELPENTVPAGAVEGLNDFQKHSYGGPCPLSGKHKYYFKLYALDIKLNLDPNSLKKDVRNAMEGHVLAQAKLMGTYGRR
jgi:Raf kinase inhibitor-like YbhB/YbcL family protein